MHFCVRRGLGLAAVLCLFGQPGSAAFTDPNLLIRGISIPSSASSRVLQVDGFFHTEDLVQISYPLHVLVWMHESTRFVRFDLTGPVASGDAAELVDGLSADEGPILALAGSPEPNAQILHIGARRLHLQLPPDFPAGLVWIQLFVTGADGGTLLSNPMSLWVP